MQLNLYVPQGQERVIDALERYVRRTGRNKNEVVLEAIREYVHDHDPRLRGGLPRLEVFDLGGDEMPSREDIYAERIDS